MTELLKYYACLTIFYSFSKNVFPAASNRIGACEGRAEKACCSETHWRTHAD
ncbi:MAG: hypothetical protein NHB15_13645 [Methanosarcina barkeri]|nr:hypothetical protein [Methanosarcina sp. ERenArc_MAG2]